MNHMRIVQLAAGIAVLSLPFLVFLVIDYLSLPEIKEESEKVTLTIPRGAQIEAIADTLLSNNLIDDKEMFILWLTTMDKDKELKAGRFDVPVGLNYAQLILYLTKAKSTEIKITLLEGWQIEQISQQLEKYLHIEKAIFDSLCRDSLFIAQFGIESNSLEGYLLPDTYFFYWGMDERQLIRFLVDKCKSLFTTPVMARLDSMNMTMHEILTLASIVEGEAVFDEERRTIASVYHNRLKKRIKLGADPTIQYIVEGPPRRLLNRDLKIDSPYNTYMYYGLPPGPINNPGKNSIHASIYPARTDYLYFVARGDGKHTFSRNHREHERAKAKFNRVRREYYRKQRSAN